MTRLQHYRQSLMKARNEDEFMGALVVILLSYSRNLISRMNGNTKYIMNWLKEKTE